MAVRTPAPETHSPQSEVTVDVRFRDAILILPGMTKAQVVAFVEELFSDSWDHTTVGRPEESIRGDQSMTRLESFSAKMAIDRENNTINVPMALIVGSRPVRIFE